MRMKDTEKMPPIDKAVYLLGYGLVTGFEAAIMITAQPLQYLQGIGHDLMDKYKHKGAPTSRVKNRRLRDAVAFGQSWLVKRAIEKGGNIDHTTGFSDQTLLGYAAEHGYLKTAGALLDAGADIDLPRKGGVTALISAVEAGKDEAARMLLERGAAIDATADDGTTALIAAADKGLTPLVQMFLEKGAKADAKRSGQTAFDIARDKGYEDIVALSQTFNASAAPAVTGQAIVIAAPLALKKNAPV